MAQPIKPTVDFNISVVGDTTGKEFVGSFSAKTKLSIREQLKENEVYREVLGTNGKDADEYSKTLASATSYLMVRVVSSPDWWKSLGFGLDIEDMNLLAAVNNSCRAAVQAEYKALEDLATDAEKALKSMQDKNAS